MNNQRFAVELDRRTVGVAVRVPGGFMFYASDDAFDQIDGRLFPRARALEHQLRKIARRPKRGTRPLHGVLRPPNAREPVRHSYPAELRQ